MKRPLSAGLLAATMLIGAAGCRDGGKEADTSAANPETGVLANLTVEQNGETFSGPIRLSDSGNAWVKSGGAITAFTPYNGVARSHFLADGNQPESWSVNTGLASGPPDEPFSALITAAAYLQSLRHAGDTRVESTSVGGRAAWRTVVATPTDVSGGKTDGGELEVTVDKATGLALSLVTRQGGKTLAEVTMSKIQVGAKLPARPFALDIPASAKVDRQAFGYTRMSLDEAIDEVDYDPLVPTQVPAGYELAEVAFARRPTPRVQTGNPTSSQVISMVYRKGYESIVVTVRPAGPLAGKWTDPFGPTAGLVKPPTITVLQNGPFKGLKAAIAVDPRIVPHLWLVNRDYVFTVAGPLSPDEMVAVAESLKKR